MTEIIVNIRWLDSYLEVFKCQEVRFGWAFIWMRLVSGENRQIPLTSVRWFSLSEESHEVKK